MYAIYRLPSGNFLGWIAANNRREAELNGRRAFGGKIKVGSKK